ncbi:quinoprotein relay system zinc metallohydrolase 2 [Pollutimonas nitritireducens]|nr:quinoprotein relay system zinc metallohydrolase 2 [Pollutimonas nitritireducens]
MERMNQCGVHASSPIAPWAAQAFTGVAKWLCAPLLCCAIPSVVLGADDPLPVQEVAAGVFVHQGVHQDAMPGNYGAIANVGFIVGGECVAVIDTGGSFAQGKALRAAISRQTSLPVCYVINTHVHPDHVYGNAAFTADQAEFVGHHNLAASMRSRDGYYAAYLERTIGPDLARQSILVPPNVPVKEVHQLDLGERTLTIQAWPTSHTDNDLTVLDETTATLWTGDLVFRERIPSLDGKLSGWLSTMESLAGIPARLVVPGHGSVSTDWPAVMKPQQQYLQQLQADVRAALKAKRSIQQAMSEIGALNPSQWQLFDGSHRQNVTAAFTELEWED